jgi:lipopolysaccharide export system protein LptA
MMVNYLPRRVNAALAPKGSTDILVCVPSIIRNRRFFIYHTNILFSNAFVAVCLVFFLSMSMYSVHTLAQEADDVQPNQPLFLQAEKLIGNATAAGFVRELIGNVVLTQGAVTITCNRAVHYIEQNRADMFGNVIMKQGTVTMKAAQGSYDGFSRQISGSGGVTLLDRNSTLTAREGWYSAATKIARFYHYVNIENDSLTIFCDTLEYHRATQNSYATGHAVAVSKVSSALLQGDSLVNIPAKRYSRISSYRSNPPPMVSQIDTVDADKPERTFQQTPANHPKHLVP